MDIGKLFILLLAITLLYSEKPVLKKPINKYNIGNLKSSKYLFDKQSYSIKIISSSSYGLSFNIKFNKTPRYKVTGPGDSEIKMDGLDNIEQFGEPGLPYAIISFAAPHDAKIILNYQSSSENVINSPFRSKSYTMPLGKPPIPHIKHGKTVQIYRDAVLYGQRIVQLIVFPVEFNLGKRAEFHKNVDIRVTFSGNYKRTGNHLYINKFAENQLSTILLNYEESKDWRKIEPGNPAEDIFSTSSVWYKITVRDTIKFCNQSDDGEERYGPGLYGYTYDSLIDAGLPVDQIDLKSLRIYTCTSNELEKQVPNDTLDEKGMVEIPIYVKDNGDNKLSRGEYFIFYAQTPWKHKLEFNSTTSTWQYKHYQNLYTDDNAYWLTWGGKNGKRITKIDGIPKDTDIDYPKNHFLYPIKEKEWYVFIGDKASYDDWWTIRQYSSYNVSTYKSILRGVESTGIGTIRVLLTRHTPSFVRGFPDDNELKITFNGKSLIDTTFSNSENLISMKCSNFTEGSNDFIIDFKPYAGSKELVFFHYFELFYPRQFKPYHDRLTVYLDKIVTNDRYKLKLSGFTASDIFLWRITDPNNPVSIEYKRDGSSSYNVTFSDSMGIMYEPQKYIAYELDKVKTPISISKYDPIHLRNKDSQADYLIISPVEFMDSFKPLVDDYAKKGIRTLLVSTEQVFNEFGWGKPDVAAIRNLAWYSYHFWKTKPQAILLGGSGNANYKNHLKMDRPNRILVYEEPGYAGTEIICFDDWFGYIEPSEQYSYSFLTVPIGRIPAETEDELKTIIKKTIQYNKTGFEQYGSWSNTTVFTADDFKKTGEEDSTRAETEHTKDTESIAEIYTPKGFFIRKVYETEYPLIQGQKPGANADLLEILNRGVTLWTYLGHGGPNAMAHEKIFKFDDVAKMQNNNKLSFFYGGSCQISEFDFLVRRSLGGELVRKDNGGCIATLAATRGTGSGGNFSLIRNILTYVFNTSNDNSMCQLVAMGKNESGNSYNTKVYVFFGDAMTKLLYPKPNLILIQIPDTLYEGKRYEIKGHMPGKQSGFAYLEIYDSVRKRHYTELGLSVDYYLPRTNIYRGFVNLNNNGEFTAPFYVPYGINPGPAAKAVVAGIQNIEQASAFKDSILLLTNDSSPSDTVPPLMRFVRNGQTLRDGDKVSSNFVLEAILEDPSGLNITRLPGKQMLLTIDDNRQNRYDITDYFSYDFDSFTKGKISYSLSLEPGKHILNLRAFDSMGNESNITVTLEAVADQNLSISSLLNYPNPVRNNNTYFTFSLSHDSDLEITILTIKGRPIHTLKARGKSGYNQISWNCRDKQGDSIGNGVYFYKLKAKGNNGEATSIGKLIIAQ
ncbi:MAG: type IX secretion system sortase PorU [Candidatus Coatesbacteria bacterium]|nr:type IX secretion system sortase PorU [Candidatus Coatesbacteria bacterium]